MEPKLERLLSTEFTDNQKNLMRELLQTFLVPIYPNDVENMLQIVHKCRRLSWEDLHKTAEFLPLLKDSGLQQRGASESDIQQLL